MTWLIMVAVLRQVSHDYYFLALGLTFPPDGLPSSPQVEILAVIHLLRLLCALVGQAGAYVSMGICVALPGVREQPSLSVRAKQRT